MFKMFVFQKSNISHESNEILMSDFGTDTFTNTLQLATDSSLTCSLMVLVTPGYSCLHSLFLRICIAKLSNNCNSNGCSYTYYEFSPKTPSFFVASATINRDVPKILKHWKLVRALF